VLTGLTGCSDRLSDLDPRPAIANVFGAHLEGREPPPGLDRPWPRLSSVPARPTPPSMDQRERISAGLAEDRASSRAPVVPGSVPRAPAAAGPPAPPRLAAMPPVRLEPTAPPANARPAAQPVPVPAPAPAPATAPAVAPQAAPAPVAPPPAPSRDLLAPPPAPSRDLLAPPPPPSRDLLAPRGG
jgi:hypothetical protein